jgi:hypothetical protein
MLARDMVNDEFPTPPRSLPEAQRRHLEDEMGLDLFVGIPVTDYTAALPWYERGVLADARAGRERAPFDAVGSALEYASGADLSS